MNIVTSLKGKAFAAALSVLALLGIMFVVLLGHSVSAPADTNLNNLDCHGHTEKAPPAADDPTSTQIKYVFACNGPITGYQIQPNLEVQSMQTEVFGTDRAGAPYSNDSFSCSGDLPGYGINCVGFGGFLDNSARTFDASQKSYVNLTGTFSIDEDICAEPRVDPLVTVMTAGIKSDGVTVTQAISGPYDLGRPKKTGCKLARVHTAQRIPSLGPDTDASNSNVG